MADEKRGWTHAEAAISAATINRFWLQRGYLAEAVVEKTFNGANGSYTVRSNCVNGIPTRKL